MAYTTVPTFTDATATAANGNAYIRDNQKALKDPPSANYEPNEGSNYTISTSTYADVDTADLTLSITTTGGDVIVGFAGTISGNGTVLLDVAVNGTRIANNTSAGILSLQHGAITPAVSFIRLVQGLSAGTHTFALMWKAVSGAHTMYAGAGTASYDVHPQFWARELT